MPPTVKNGKICYVEVPATDIQRSADFYSNVFGWNMRKRGDGATAFDDAIGEVSGAFVKGRPPAATPGLMLYIMVDSVEKTIEAVKASLLRPSGACSISIQPRPHGLGRIPAPLRG